MANTFKVVTHDVMSASANTAEDLYTTPNSTTTVVIGIVLANIHTSQVTASLKLVSDTSGGGRSATNTTTFLVKDAPIPVGSSLEFLSGAKVVLEATDKLQVACSIADKVSVTASIMEQT
jgi:hypothetical protein|tara:strand:- start:120 stop:479 length:360 start_codon:yes stop_codon:yes gene_type:complete